MAKVTVQSRGPSSATTAQSNQNGAPAKLVTSSTAKAESVGTDAAKAVKPSGLGQPVALSAPKFVVSPTVAMDVAAGSGAVKPVVVRATQVTALLGVAAAATLVTPPQPPLALTNKLASSAPPSPTTAAVTSTVGGSPGHQAPVTAIPTTVPVAAAPATAATPTVTLPATPPVTVVVSPAQTAQATFLPLTVSIIKYHDPNVPVVVKETDPLSKVPLPAFAPQMSAGMLNVAAVQALGPADSRVAWKVDAEKARLQAPIDNQNIVLMQNWQHIATPVLQGMSTADLQALYAGPKTGVTSTSVGTALVKEVLDNRYYTSLHGSMDSAVQIIKAPAGTYSTEQVAVAQSYANNAWEPIQTTYSPPPQANHYHSSGPNMAALFNDEDNGAYLPKPLQITMGVMGGAVGGLALGAVLAPIAVPALGVGSAAAAAGNALAGGAAASVAGGVGGGGVGTAYASGMASF